MEDQRKYANWGIVAGIIELFNILIHYFVVAIGIGGSFLPLFTSIVSYFITLVLCIILFLKRQDMLLLILLAVRAVWNLFIFCQSLFSGNSSVTIFVNLFTLLSSAGVFAIAYFTLQKKNSKMENLVKQIWFLPAVFSFAASSIYFLSPILQLGSSLPAWYHIDRFLNVIFSVLSVIFICKWLTSDRSAESDTKKPMEPERNNRITTTVDGYYNILTHVLLLLFTFGVWACIWVYRTTEFLNRDTDEEYRNPTTKLLLCMFVPFYAVYWTYKSAQRIDRLASKNEVPSDISTLCLVLSIVIPLVAYIVMQDKINNIVTAKSNPAPIQNKASEDTVGQLKSYKDLLDSGVITQEEFDAKKKQLLGL